MANNPFSKMADVNNNVPRATFDLSHQNNLTTTFGRLTPILCLPVLPGTSVRIGTNFGFRLMPMVFPVQTRMKAYVHYFYVRNRSLWKDWQDFIFNTKKDLVSPYISTTDNERFRTGGLLDYLGVPTRLYGDFSSTYVDSYSNLTNYIWNNASTGQINRITVFGSRVLPNSTYEIGDIVIPRSNSFISQTAPVVQGYNFAKFSRSLFSTMTNSAAEFNIETIGTSRNPATVASFFGVSGNVYYLNGSNELLYKSTYKQSNGVITLANVSEAVDDANVVSIIIANTQTFTATFPTTSGGYLSNYVETSKATVIRSYSGGHDLADLSASENPYMVNGSNPKRPLSAFLPRAYESIYNAYYRNQQNDPFRINGEIEYNKWIPSDEGGADSYNYQLHYRNWEQDVFSTCMPNPQYGEMAPLVGLSSNGESTSVAFMDEDGNMNTVRMTTDDNGVTSIDIADESETTQEKRTFYSLKDLMNVEQGISINDFRNVNALQRWLELQQRKGFRYKDLTKGHFDVDIRFDELQMPEFIGGTSKPVFVNQITSSAATQTTDSDGSVIDAPLGSWAGQAGIVGESKSISHYCDEHGFIIGIFSVVPVPIYPQMIEKHWYYDHHMDYYTPEFANIGYQELRKDLLCPLQYYNSDDANPVFGYQRPWYEYLSKQDTAHGLFRSELRNFIMNRTFDGVPTLGHDFLAVDPEQLSDVFAVTDVTDKIIGEVDFDLKVKHPIPYLSIPRID